MAVERAVDAQDLARVEFAEKFGVEAAALDGQVVQLPLLIALAQNVLLDGVFRHQAIDVHFARLPNAVAPILGLQRGA